ncbi:MAG: class I SAM-dependent rRNA methyltransferase [Acidimicrobiia bacterium]|nr:class I SAM-dependent rRNA methyltransferase [Acidimicrobiia bacterium]
MPSSELRLTRKGAERILSGHPWVFASDVSGDASPGATVSVLDHKGRPLGTAHYSSTSQIRLRILDRQAIPVNRQFYFDRIQAAARHREFLGISSGAYRLVYSEADLLPGLIVDRYGDCYVIQALSQGMDRATDLIVSCLVELFSPQAIVARNDSPTRKKEDLPLEKKLLHGSLSDEQWITMNGLRWKVEPLEGQKTGLYLDQRENYVAAARYGHGKALDCFTSTGGFALHLAGRCETVEAVDSSSSSLAVARGNAEANNIGNVAFKEADVFDLLAGYAAAGRRFDTVILDPPAFAKSRSAVAGALRGYRDINTRALKLLSPRGILVSCSCSHHMAESALLEVIARAALDAGRSMRILERRTQAQDHPILLTVPETHYLKCLVLQA